VKVEEFGIKRSRNRGAAFHLRLAQFCLPHSSSQSSDSSALRPQFTMLKSTLRCGNGSYSCRRLLENKYEEAMWKSAMYEVGGVEKSAVRLRRK
jgi:hypothetical protein